MYYRSLQLPPPLSYEQGNIINDFRILMSRLAYLSRFYIVESLTGLGNPDAVINEFLKLPVEGNEIARTIPDFTVDFVPVTSTYVGGLKNLIDGMIAGDTEKADESIRQLYAASDQNAAYLARLSPYWDENKWRDIFYCYNRDLVAEVIAIQTGDYNKALDVFDTMMQKALERGDYYAEGFIHLLPVDQQKIPITYFNMIKDFRKIQTEWAYLTRFYMIANIVGLGNEEYVTQRFYELTRRMKEKFELIFGTEIAEELLNLLSIYVIKLQGITDVIQSGVQADIEAQTIDLYQGADFLAAYLSSINSYWNEAKWKELLYTFDGFLIKESNELQRKDYVAAMQTFQSLLYSSLEIGDYFALGMYQYGSINGANQTE